MNKTTSLILLLLALLVWLLLGSWLYRRSCCIAGAAATTGAVAPVGGENYCGQWTVSDESNFDQSASRYLRFVKNEVSPLAYQDDVNELLDKVATYQSDLSDKNLVITGIYDDSESYEGAYDNLGIERAEIVKSMMADRGANAEMILVESGLLEDGGFVEDTLCHGIEMFFSDGATSDVEEDSNSGAAAAITAESVCSDLDSDGLILYFAFSSDATDFSEEERGYLDALVSCLESRSDATIKVDGHTDNVGGSSNNQTLSRARARKIRKYLTAAGIQKSRITIEGFGDTNPIESNDTEEGRAKNRRVEIKLN